ncbi:MAG TPA: tetratricopeptide repeat protein [Candidatus Angelobacter sp.]|nr:tetratricopeptide repeat protein [Candidatus Angelobacter sp.]
MRDKALAGDVQAAETLGMAYQLGCPGSRPDRKEALRWYHMAADKGSSIAENQIGVSFDPEEGFVHDHGHDASEALKWYQKAAERGDDSVALYNVAVTLCQMKRCPEAVDWLRRAVSKGQPASAEMLWGMYDHGLAAPGKSKHDRRQEQKDFFLRSASEGNAGAQYLMGEAYLRGLLDLHRDPQQAVAFLRQSSEQGFAEAEYELAGIYYDGKLLPKDRTESAKWLLKAADQGMADAALDLALLYEKGDGVPQDFPAALMWYEFAQAGGARRAQVPKNARGVFDWARLHHTYTEAETKEANRRMQVWLEEHGKVEY